MDRLVHRVVEQGVCIPGTIGGFLFVYHWLKLATGVESANCAKPASVIPGHRSMETSMTRMIAAMLALLFGTTRSPRLAVRRKWLQSMRRFKRFSLSDSDNMALIKYRDEGEDLHKAAGGKRWAHRAELYRSYRR